MAEDQEPSAGAAPDAPARPAEAGAPGIEGAPRAEAAPVAQPAKGKGEALPSTPARRAWRRLRIPIRLLVVFGLLELFARQFVARPNRIIRHSDDAEMVYENSPGTWLGHAKFNIWYAPIYMVLDLINTGADGRTGPAPPGYTIYKIDDDGCRVDHDGPGMAQADVVLLGSSQAFGLFVPVEETVSDMLEKSLRQRGFEGVHVANCGVIGHHFPQTLRTAERQRRAKRPKLIVTLVRPWHLREQFDYTEVLEPKNGFVRWLTHQSSLARAIFYFSRREPDQFNKPLVGGDVLEAKLDHYARDLAEDGTRSLFLLLDDKNSDCNVYDDLEPLLRRKGLLVERVPTPSGPRDYFVDHDQHWSAKGAAYTRDELLGSVIRELGLAGITPGPRSKGNAAP